MPEKTKPMAPDWRTSEVLDAIGEGVFVLDANERLRFANRKALEMWQRRADEVIGRRLLEAFPQIEDSDPYRSYRKVFEERSPVHIETRALAFGGRWIGLDVYPAPEGGLVVAFRDIDDRKQIEEALRAANEQLEQRVALRAAELVVANEALKREIAEHKRTAEITKEREERYRTLYNRTPMALQSVDENARLVDVNDHWVLLFGYPREQVLGRSPSEFMTSASATRYQQNAWPEMLVSRGDVRAVEYQFVKYSGETFEGRLSACGEFGPDGQFVRSWSVIADITAERLAETELLRAQRMDAVGQLTAGVAHDFNNLLMSVMGNLEMLEARLTMDERTARFLTAAREGAERGSRLTAQLLAFSRSQRMAPEPTDLNQVIRTMGPLLQSTIGATVRIRTVLADDLWLALVDVSQVELVLLNLVINARDATALGGTITVETANIALGPPSRLEDPPAGDYVLVAVTDTGTGIQPELLHQVFEPFFTTKPVGKGSGLGLSQALGVAQQLGGGVRIESELGQGTTVRLYLPRTGAEASGSVATIATEVPDTAGVGDRHRAVIMLVDDDEDVRGVTGALLKDQGHEVIEARTGEAALLGLERVRDRLELMIIDFAMPDMNGLELSRLAQRSVPGLPILFITGLATAAKLATDNPSIEVLQKPFSGKELQLTVSAVIAAARRCEA
jgi:PAS domain S-box-containing protein